jgi:hypothetical protein
MKYDEVSVGFMRLELNLKILIAQMSGLKNGQTLKTKEQSEGAGKT